jgi:hypothetical protein
MAKLVSKQTKDRHILIFFLVVFFQQGLMCFFGCVFFFLSVLYKPSGALLNKLMAPHQKPSINDVKDEWFDRCDALKKKTTLKDEMVGAAPTMATRTPPVTHVVVIDGIGHGMRIGGGGGGGDGGSGQSWVLDAVLLVIVVVLAGLWRYVTKGKVVDLRNRNKYL